MLTAPLQLSDQLRQPQIFLSPNQAECLDLEKNKKDLVLKAFNRYDGHPGKISKALVVSKRQVFLFKDRYLIYYDTQEHCFISMRGRLINSDRKGRYIHCAIEIRRVIKKRNKSTILSHQN